jgi:hypothetical protein
MTVLLTPEVCHCIIEQRLLKAFIHDVLEQIALEALCMAHLAEDLTVTAYDSLNSII